jgi:hypothetical protein
MLIVLREKTIKQVNSQTKYILQKYAKKITF